MDRFLSIVFFISITLLMTDCGSTEPLEKNTINTIEQEKMIEAKTPELNIFKNLSLVDDENVFISPLSIKVAFSMLYNAIDNETKIEFDKVLNQNQVSLDAYNIKMQTLIQQLTSAKTFTLNISNSCWVKESLRPSVLSDFQENLTRYYSADTRFLDFLNPQSSKIINNWVAENTNQKIKTIVPEQLNPDQIAFLINTVYFDADWTLPFEKDNTTNQPFTTQKNQSTEVSTMIQMSYVEYFKNEDFESVTLTYGEDKKAEAIIILPKNITSFLNTLNEDIINEIISKREVKNGNIYLPKIDFSYEKDLISSFRKIGINLVFNEGQADLGKMFELKSVGEPFVSSVLHKTYVRMDEKGTEAAGATSIGISVTSVPMIDFEFKANKPYVIIFRDTETGELLFLGKIADPTMN